MTEDFKSLQGDHDLKEVVQEAREAGVRYAMGATYPGASNKQAADELATILNQMYQSPLYNQGEPFVGYVLFKEGKEYRLQE